MAGSPERLPLPLMGATRDGVELAFFAYTIGSDQPWSVMDPAGWPHVDGIRAPEMFDAVEWHDDDLVVTYTIALDPSRDAFQVERFAAERAGDDDHPDPYPVTGADAERIHPDRVLEDALAFFERTTKYDRLAAVPSSAATAPAPRSRKALRRRQATPKDELQRVGRIYMANLDDKPAEAVKDALDVSRSTADRRIREAREAGYITAAAARGRKPRPATTEQER